MENKNIYQEHGFESRRAYLEDLADNFSVPIGTVVAIAHMLGENEDFDGLVTALEDEADRLEDLDYEMDVG